MTSPTSSTFVREPRSEELGRVLPLFRSSHVPRRARLFALVKRHPVERFVAAVAWWVEGAAARFKLALQPGLSARAEAVEQLIARVTDCCRAAGITALCFGELVPDGSEWVALLEGNGFKVFRSERFFEISTTQARTRTFEMFEKHGASIPSSWRTSSIREHAPDEILDLIAPHHLMPVDEVRQLWRPDASNGFHRDGSSILFVDSVPRGVLLVRQIQDTYLIDVRVVRIENRLLRSLGNVMLLYHLARRHDPSGPVQRLQFRGGETEHRETANLARRMGGFELPPRHIYARSLA